MLYISLYNLYVKQNKLLSPHSSATIQTNVSGTCLAGFEVLTVAHSAHSTPPLVVVVVVVSLLLLLLLCLVLRYQNLLIIVIVRALGTGDRVDPRNFWR